MKLNRIPAIMWFVVIVFSCDSCFYDNKRNEAKIKLARDEYLNLFSKNQRKKFYFWNSKASDVQHPFVYFTYGNAMNNDTVYSIIVYKVNILNDTPLEKMIVPENRIIDDYSIIYNGWYSDHADFMNAPHHDSLVNKIYLSYDDTLLSKNAMGDSIIYYDFSATQLS